MSSSTTPTAFEQMMLEYINRARLDPQGEFDALILDAANGTAVQDNVTNAVGYFGVDLALFESQLAAFEAVAPLAWNGALSDAAAAHSQAMIDYATANPDRNAQQHQLPGEDTVGTRITDAGYDWSAYRENIFAHTKDPLHAHAAFYIDWGRDAGGMQDPAGHRLSILSDGVTELGLSALAAPEGLSVGPWVVTQDFANRWDYQPQLVGVVIDDADGDRFYDMGEGLGGITVTATGSRGTYTTTSWEAGGYQMELPSGRYEVAFTGAGIEGEIVHEVTMGSENLKLDGIAGDATEVVIETVIYGTGENERLTALDGHDQSLIGSGGADTLEGSDGDNLLIGDRLEAASQPELAGQVYRLYLATLGREPDATGHDAWTERLLTGEQSLTQVVTGFVNSPEFRATYGPLDDAAFVALLYENVLGRAPDAVGLDNWVAQLVVGISREQVVLGFSQSLELISSTRAEAQRFAAAHSEAGWGDDVFRLYQATLDRAPDLTGFGRWSAELAGGAEYADVAAGFVESPEFRAMYGALDDEGFVTLLYENVLGRAADATGLANWTGQLEAGTSRVAVVEGFAQSAEFIVATTSDYEQWMRDQGTDDRLSSGGGSDVMIGGAGADVFVLAAGETVTVVDLDPWDTLELTGFGFAGSADAIAAFETVGADLVLSEAGSDLVLQGAASAGLSDEQILLA